MMTNDPFKTRGDITKVLLQNDLSKMRLVDYICMLNPDLPKRDYYRYFHNLYKKFPELFELVDGRQLFFSGILVTSFFRETQVLKASDIDSFFGLWRKSLVMDDLVDDCVDVDDFERWFND